MADGKDKVATLNPPASMSIVSSEACSDSLSPGSSSTNDGSLSSSTNDESPSSTNDDDDDESTRSPYYPTKESDGAASRNSNSLIIESLESSEDDHDLDHDSDAPAASLEASTPSPQHSPTEATTPQQSQEPLDLDLLKSLLEAVPKPPAEILSTGPHIAHPAAERHVLFYANSIVDLLLEYDALVKPDSRYIGEFLVNAKEHQNRWGIIHLLDNKVGMTFHQQERKNHGGVQYQQGQMLVIYNFDGNTHPELDSKLKTTYREILQAIIDDPEVPPPLRHHCSMVLHRSGGTLGIERNVVCGIIERSTQEVFNLGGKALESMRCNQRICDDREACVQHIAEIL